MQTELQCINVELLSRDELTLRQGIGIHMREVIAGNLGSSQRLEFTVVGATATPASRIEGLSRDFPAFPALISEAVLDLLPDRLDVEPLGEHRSKEWPHPIAVCGLRGLR
jgi:adenylate cyclase